MDAQAGSTSLPPSSLSTHRLPTVSASHALRKLRSDAPLAISTGLQRLDGILAEQRAGIVSSSALSRGGGLVRGQITEVYGPPGVGKTAFCMQATVAALHAGNKMVWIDASTPLAPPRLDELLTTIREGPNTSTSTLPDLRRRFKHYAVPTLPHLLALLLHPPPSFPPRDCSLIVIDSISTLIENAYQKSHHGRPVKKTDAAKWAAGRKYAVMGEIISKLGRMAAINNAVVLLTSHAMTRIRSGLGALLLPAISGTEWENGISTQLVLFRDWPPQRNTQISAEDAERWKSLRYVGVIKVNGVLAADDGRFETVVPFSIEKEGLVELSCTSTDVTVPILSSPTRPAKRTFEEIADSEEEEPLSEDDYGWENPDNELTAGLIKTTDLLSQTANAQGESD